MRITGYVETEPGSGAYRPGSTQNRYDTSLPELYERLADNLQGLSAEDDGLEMLIAEIVAGWLAYEPNAYRSLLAFRFRSERTRLLRNLDEVVLQTALIVLAREMSDDY